MLLPSPASHYLDLFRSPTKQSAASLAYHQRCMEPNDQVLWLSRLRPPVYAGWVDLIKQCGFPPRGVLHVGAHYGLELENYLAAGCRRVVFFEASPLVLGQLHAHVKFWQDWLRILDRSDRMRVEVVEKAVSDGRREAHFHVAELEMLSSLHQPEADWIQVQDQITVACDTLDALVSEPQDFNILNLDVQGHELEVLSGAARTLPFLDAILIELNLVQRYHGGAGAAAVDEWLTEAGWTGFYQIRYGDVIDALYLRNLPKNGLEKPAPTDPNRGG